MIQDLNDFANSKVADNVSFDKEKEEVFCKFKNTKSPKALVKSGAFKLKKIKKKKKIW